MLTFNQKFKTGIVMSEPTKEKSPVRVVQISDEVHSAIRLRSIRTKRPTKEIADSILRADLAPEITENKAAVSAA